MVEKCTALILVNCSLCLLLFKFETNKTMWTHFCQNYKILEHIKHNLITLKAVYDENKSISADIFFDSKHNRLQIQIEIIKGWVD